MRRTLIATLVVGVLLASVVLERRRPLEAQTASGAFTLLESATLTTTTNGSTRTVSTATRGLQLLLNVSAASGTTPTLDVKLQWQDPLTSTWSDLHGAAFQRITAVGTRTLTIYPSPQPDGHVRLIVGTNPAAFPTEILETVPANTRWKLLSFQAALTTNATAGNRVPVLTFDDGTNQYIRANYPTNQTASATWNNTWSAGGQYVTGAGIGVQHPLPMGVYLLGGHRIQVVTSAGVAGDDWGAPLMLVEEFQGNYAEITVPRLIRAVSTIGGTTPSFTFSVAGVTLP